MYLSLLSILRLRPVPHSLTIEMDIAFLAVLFAIFSVFSKKNCSHLISYRVYLTVRRRGAGLCTEVVSRRCRLRDIFFSYIVFH